MLDEADPATTTIILHMFDNSVFLGNVDGNVMLFALKKKNTKMNILATSSVFNEIRFVIVPLFTSF